MVVWWVGYVFERKWGERAWYGTSERIRRGKGGNVT
jgi:hypothetical protein